MPDDDFVLSYDTRPSVSAPLSGTVAAAPRGR